LPGENISIVCPFCQHTLTLGSQDLPLWTISMSSLKRNCPRCKRPLTVDIEYTVKVVKIK
jgi:hypothetical protein